MTEKSQLKLIQGGNDLQKPDWAELLEKMDLNDAMPVFRRLRAKMRPAANSVLAIVEPEKKAVAEPNQDQPDNTAPV